MAAKGSGESKSGLVVFLVLFVLLSIGLGVTTYLGYQEADAERKKTADADKKAKDWENDANWYKFVADTYRMYLGYSQPTGDDVAAMRGQYGDGTGTLFTASRDKAKEEHKKAITDTLDKNFKWDATVKKPANTAQDEIDRLNKEVAKQKDLAQKADAHAAEMEALADARKREKEAAELNYKTELAKVRKLSDDSVAQKDQTIEKLTKELDTAGEAGKKALTPLLDENKKLLADNKRATAELTGALKTISEQGLKSARATAAEEIDVSKIAPENLAKITRIGGNGDMPYISLGSADNLKRGVTFGIYGKGTDGKPLRTPKGRLEVVSIVGERLAQGRVMDLRDGRRDPVLPGDFIYSPTWNPNVKQHVAIIGLIDLVGDGRDHTAEFIHSLEAQNVTVDAWMDTKAAKMHGDIARQTDLLIVGASPDFGSGAVRSGDTKDDAKSQLVKDMQREQDKAEKLGVRIVRLSTFLEMSGYPLPKTLGADKGKVGFQRELPAAGSPVERREPPK